MATVYVPFVSCYERGYWEAQVEFHGLGKRSCGITLFLWVYASQDAIDEAFRQYLAQTWGSDDALLREVSYTRVFLGRSCYVECSAEVLYTYDFERGWYTDAGPPSYDLVNPTRLCERWDHLGSLYYPRIEALAAKLRMGRDGLLNCAFWFLNRLDRAWCEVWDQLVFSRYLEAVAALMEDCARVTRW